MIVMLLLSGCATTVGSKAAVCSIERPELQLDGISDANLIELDLFAERFARACS